MRNRRPSFDSRQFSAVVDQAGGEIVASLRRSASAGNHHPTAGAIREHGLRDFLRQLLPDHYYVGTGFAFDATDALSKQLDIIIALRPPLVRVFEKDDICYLPCEVVLAVIEVKNALDSGQLDEIIVNANSVRCLKPFGTQIFTDSKQGGAALRETEHRCFYSVVATTSDLAVAGWDGREWKRLREKASAAGVEPSLIDRIVILDRGIVNASDGRSLQGKGQMESLTTQWFVHLANYLDREAKRRPPLDIDIYTQNVPWTKLT